ncbi:MAG: hypothetical protein PQJ50_05925 [Spirochaetales bacterium]|nr:hypothetical protein [Spirochaetales bacterium]
MKILLEKSRISSILIFGGICAFLGFTLYNAAVLKVPVTINDIVISQDSQHYTLLTLALAVLLLAAVLLLLNSILAKKYLVIDEYHKEIVRENVNMLQQSRIEFTRKTSSIKEIILVSFEEYRGGRRKEFFKIYLIDNEDYFDEISTDRIYRIARNAAEQISRETGIPLKDDTEREYEDEFDFVKRYNRRESQD